jgi:L-rhamnose mutarotase
MRRAVFFRLKPGKGDEYRQCHAQLPADMRCVLNEAGLRNYSIWNHQDMLFGYYEVEDEGRMHRVLQSSEVYARWRTSMEAFVEIDAQGQKEWPMEIVFLHTGKEEQTEIVQTEGD